MGVCLFGRWESNPVHLRTASALQLQISSRHAPCTTSEFPTFLRTR